jgi:hypothetical protein
MTGPEQLYFTHDFFNFGHNTKVLIPCLYIEKEIHKISTIVLYIIDLNKIILNARFGYWWWGKGRGSSDY